MTEEEEQQTDMSISSAIYFFLMASAMLLVLYLFIDQLRWVFTLLIVLSCIGCFSILVEDFLLQGFKPKSGDMLKYEIYIPCCGKTSVASILGTVSGIVFCGWWYITRNWILNNLLAIVLSITFLKTVRLTSLTPGILLLSLLFIYDIFWVFISPMFTRGGDSVMVTVATGLDVPIKLDMPHILIDQPTSSCSMLGLGDILIPGIFICYMARFGTEVVKSEVYYFGAIFAYTVGLLTCGGFLWLMNMAQPALLYIVPALIIAVFVIGGTRGEINQLREGIPPIERVPRNDEDRENLNKRDMEMMQITRS
mmetsp:Transcript_16105/g.11620  ORF Transcript_16105/g.11620 Transcript_16105/m.11620 type:complete len:309 (-) Transcript_16105:22-948(-)